MKGDGGGGDAHDGGKRNRGKRSPQTDGAARPLVDRYECNGLWGDTGEGEGRQAEEGRTLW